MLPKKQRPSTIPEELTIVQNGRLKRRLHEINVRSEKELAIIFDTIEKAKAAFRSKK